MDSPDWLSEEGRLFQNTVRQLFQRELEPNIAEFESRGVVDRAFWRRMAEHGILCPSIPEDYGGHGADFSFNMAVSYECGYCIGGTSLGITVQSDIIAFYLLNHGSEAQKAHYL